MINLPKEIKDIGWCEFFDVKPFIDAANILVAADEPLRAIQLLDNLPGYYRDFIPKEVIELKKSIYALLATPAFYQSNPYDQLVRVEKSTAALENTLRGMCIWDDVQFYNKQNITPHIIDLGPGEYWLPIGLWKKRALFTYQAIGLCSKAHEKAMEYIKQFYLDTPPKDRPKIFIACELIEHLHHEEDIRVEFERINSDADIIHISTPLYTFDGRKAQIDWQKKGDLGHLRTYTPKEFFSVVTEIFPEYNWELKLSQVMHMRGVSSNK